MELTLHLSEEMYETVQNQLKSGHYNSLDDAIHDALTHMQKYEWHGLCRKSDFEQNQPEPPIANLTAEHLDDVKTNCPNFTL